MASPTISSSQDLLDRVWKYGEETALIQNTQKLVLIHGMDLSQDDLDRYTPAIRHLNLGPWLQRSRKRSRNTAVIYESGQADRPLQIPKIVLSGAMQEPEYPADDGLIPNFELRYLLIFQGESGDDKLKIVIEPSRERAALTMLHEALNGYSTVFSAAIPQIYVEWLSVPGSDFVCIPYTAALMPTISWENGKIFMCC